MSISRRAALGGLAASTAVLAGCGQVTSAEPTSSATEIPTGEVKLGLTSEVAVGSGAKFAINKSLTVLVTQPIEGVFKAFDATCTHAGCIVNGVEDGEIACGCHGARFDAESGMAIAPPAKTALGKIPLEVRGQELWVVL
ncbi:MAG: hypothetical protein RL418_388 [Actinomycetota bacterium]